MKMKVDHTAKKGERSLSEDTISDRKLPVKVERDTIPPVDKHRRNSGRVARNSGNEDWVESDINSHPSKKPGISEEKPYRERKDKHRNNEPVNLETKTESTRRPGRRKSDRQEAKFDNPSAGKKQSRPVKGSHDSSLCTDSKVHRKSVSFSDSGDADNSLNVDDLQNNIAALTVDAPTNAGDSVSESKQQQTKSINKSRNERRKGRHKEASAHDAAVNSEHKPVSINDILLYITGYRCFVGVILL